MQIFQRNILNKYIEGLDNTLIDERYKTFSSFFLDSERQANILNSKEEQFQEGFLRELFVKILGYTLNPDPNFNLTTEKKNETNSKKADGAILVDGKVVGVIELKDHKTPDLSKVEAQAFNYKSQHKEAVYVVISNFEKLRFYIDNAVDFEEFDLFHLTRDDFARLWICLAHENIAKNLPKQIKAASLTNEDQITNALYKDYSNFKRDLFDDILKNNPTDDTEHKILLFKKTQKLLDRLLFIFFAEDRGLLPPNSIMLIINQWEKLKELDEYQPFYNRLKKYFGYMNTGFQGKNYEVFAYNGGLFKPDEVLDGLTISDEVLSDYCKKIADYDFASDVDVNILGHIFENSLTEIEEITTRLSTMGHDSLAQPLQKRKKDGVFYTPQYITKYIVENTVGKLCREKKEELGIDESEYFTDKKRQVATKKALIQKLDAYRDWLLQISICDPACGSGAFLNAALNFLIAEHKLIDEMTAKVEGAAIVFPNVENSILENNLYGVDINEESVEIAKLSLWLRTAKPHRKLNSLNDNIKCGNSLIDDPAIAGDKAFCWEKEFPKVFREKQKRPWHITTAVHDSRTSDRMIEYDVRRLRDNGTRPYPEPMLLSEEEEIIITETVAKIVEEDKLNVLAYNICFDHMHLLLVCEEVDDGASREYRHGKNCPDDYDCGSNKGACPLDPTGRRTAGGSNKGACPLDPTGRRTAGDSNKGSCPLDPTGRREPTGSQERPNTMPPMDTKIRQHLHRFRRAPLQRHRVYQNQPRAPRPPATRRGISTLRHRRRSLPTRVHGRLRCGHWKSAVCAATNDGRNERCVCPLRFPKL